MSDNNYRVEWADGTSTEVSFRLLPLIQLEIEDEFGAPWLDLITGPKERAVFSKALWRWFQLRQGDEREFTEWLAQVDGYEPIGELLEALQRLARDEGSGEPPAPLDVSGSSSGSSEPPTDPANPFTP